MTKYRINKSLLSPEDQATYDAIIAKAAVPFDEEVDDDEEEFPVKPKKKAEETPMAKSASPELEAALARLETLEKSIEMKEFTDIAKKYAPLGEKEEDLANTLYEMKKSNEANYNAYIGILDKSLGIVEKSGIFTEIGKSTSGVAGGPVEKIEAVASEIQKADPTMSREEAVAKAWEDNPELLAEYEETYKR